MRRTWEARKVKLESDVSRIDLRQACRRVGRSFCCSYNTSLTSSFPTTTSSIYADMQEQSRQYSICLASPMWHSAMRQDHRTPIDLYCSDYHILQVHRLCSVLKSEWSTILMSDRPGTIRLPTLTVWMSIPHHHRPLGF